MSTRERLAALTAGARAWYAGHSARDQRIIAGIVVLAVLSLAYVGIVVPVRDFRQAVAVEIEEAQHELERDARFLGAIESLRAERAALEKKLQQARSRLLPGRTGTLGAAALQERTNALAAEKGVTIQSTQVMKEETMDPYRKVAVRLTLSGELKPFADMVSGLEYGQQLSIPFVEITRRGAVAGAKGPRTLSATMEVNGFVLAEEPKAEEAKGEDTVQEGEGGAEGAAGAGVAEPGAAVPPGGEPPEAPSAEPAEAAAPANVAGAPAGPGPEAATTPPVTLAAGTAAASAPAPRAATPAPGAPAAAPSATTAPVSPAGPSAARAPGAAAPSVPAASGKGAAAPAASAPAPAAPAPRPAGRD